MFKNTISSLAEAVILPFLRYNFSKEIMNDTKKMQNKQSL